ncbi:MAG: sulfocyanin-like copper-binding protein [Anaerolineales bacterium]
MKKQGRRLAGILILGVLLVAALAACGSGKSSVDVTLTGDYQIQLASSTASAGEVTFNIENTAQDVEHEFVIVKTDLSPSDFPTDDNGDVPEDQVDIVTEQEAIEPGTSATLVANLEAGHYVLMCNLPGHFMQGMYAEFTVQ